VLTPEHLPALRSEHPGADRPRHGAEVQALAPEQAQERQALLEMLEAARWNISQVAKAQGVSRNTLYRRMHRLHVPVTQSE
jgi:transcriptional regulator of acetoin/glycerol metabolism